MARTTVDIEVFEGTDTIDVAHDRPVRLMPNGLAGVVYRDEVYPLYAGNIIDLDDSPLEKELCQRFLVWGAPIPYWPEPAEDSAVDGEFPTEDLGIGAWYLESNKLGHYLAFDASETAAERLAAAIDESGLGVLKLGASFRPAADGQQYDWYIRLRFRGSRARCLSEIEDILRNEVGDVGGEYFAESGEDTQSVQPELANLDDVVARLVARMRAPMERDDVEETLRAFGNGSTYFGYLSWRFADFSTRPGHSPDRSPADTVEILSSIVREDKELIARIENEYGNFLEGSSRLAQRAIDLEFERIDLDDSWHSGDGALRRSRASMRFLRKAVVLTLASGDYPDRLLPMLNQLKPPAAVQFNDALPRNVTVAVTNLRRMATLVQELFDGDEVQLETLCERGCTELLALKGGHFDFLTDQAVTPVADQADPAVAGQLPFVILPPGERIQSIVGDLRKSALYRQHEVDFGRIKVLTDLSEMIGPQHCSLYSGIFPSSGRDNGYMVLVIAFEDYGEDAVAVSPWKNEHATYVVRQSEVPWQSVLSRTKDEAIQLGARRLHFKPNPEHGMDQHEAMREKILALLSCDPDEFETGALHFDPYLNRYVLREGERRRPSPPKRVDDHSRSNDLPGFFQRIKDWFDRNVEM